MLDAPVRRTSEVARPIQGTKESNLILLGTNKFEKIQCSDSMTGGQGGGDIDDVIGFDAATFCGHSA